MTAPCQTARPFRLWKHGMPNAATLEPTLHRRKKWGKDFRRKNSRHTSLIALAKPKEMSGGSQRI
jgi:hypothetical protein